MRNNTMIKTVSIVLSAVLACTALTGCRDKNDKVETDNSILDEELNGTKYVQTQYTEIAEKVKKDETVYVNASPDGKIYNVSVTDWLHTDEPQVRVEDVSNLNNIQNVKTLTEPIVEDNTLLWDMDTTDLYYSGTSDKEPPITFTIKYFLDGKEISADKIAGQKGKVSIQITVNNSLKKKIKISGKECEITCPMLVAGGTIMTEGTFSNIAIDYGKTISDGDKQIVFFAGVPGIDESLGLSSISSDLIDKSMFTSTYTITAETNNFELGNMMFAVIPLSSVGSLGSGGLTNSIDGVKSVLTDVESLQAAMNALNLDKITSLLYGDSNKLEEIMDAVGKASELYSKNEKTLKVLGKYMTKENLDKLDKLVTDLEKTDMDSVAKTLSDPKIKQLLKLLPKLSSELSELSQLSDDINAVMPIFNSLSEDMEDPEIQKSIQNLPQTVNELNDIIAVLNKNKDLLETFGDLASSDSEKQIETIMKTADKYAKLDSLSPEQISALIDKAEEWVKYGNSYDIFTERTEKTNSTVIFTYKTDAISAAEAISSSSDVQVQETESDNKFVAWFKNLFK